MIWLKSLIFGLCFYKVKSDLADNNVIPIKPKNPISNEELVDDSEFHLAPDMRSTPGCGFQLAGLKAGAKGVIETPNYPENYPSDIQCIWWLKSEIHSRVHVTCDDIETQPCNPDFYDYALFAPDWSWQKYSIACGKSQTPLKMISTTTEFSIFFRSSLKDQFRGFRCEYRVIPELLATSTAAPSTTVSTTTESPDSMNYNGVGNCGLSKSQASRIVGGEPATPHEFPWLVGLSLNETWFCGGSLISPKWVLTAAHCTSGAAYAHVILGAHHLYNHQDQPNYKTMKTMKFINHPDYNPDQIANDVALVELPIEVEYNEDIQPACLPLKDSVNSDITGTKMVAAGWGKVNDSSSISPLLNKLNVAIVTNEKCKQTFGNIVQDTTLCAIGLEGNTGTCQGDSGSSLQYKLDASENRWVQAGVVSFGAATGCADDHPNGYTRIGYYLDWISSITDLEFH